MNKKDEKIKKLLNKGLPLPVIARKLGYTGNATSKGIERIQDAIKRLKLYG